MRNDMPEKIKQHYCQLGLYVKADIINDFNKLSYKVINDIKENSKTANDEKWNEWVEQSRKNKDIQEYIALNPYTPIKVLDGLISKGRIYQDTIIDLATRKDLTVPLIEKMISKANEKTFKSIYFKNDTDLVKKIKAIVEQNIEKINDSTTQDKKLKEDFYKKLSIFDKKIESIKIQEETEKTKINTVSKYIQNLHKDCEVYAHLDDLIDAIEFDEK